MKKGKTTFSKEFKESVLELYKKAGPKAASEVFGVEKSLLLAWRRNMGVERFSTSTAKKKWANPGVKIKKRQYSKEFKLEVLEFFKENGAKATVAKFEINSNLIYKWRKAHSDENLKASNSFLKEKDEGLKKEADDPLKLLEKIESYQRYSDEQKLEVLDFYSSHGKEATLSRYGITCHRLTNWKKKFQLSGKRASKKEMEFRREVLDHATTFGIKAASEKHGVSIPTIWDWKSKSKINAGKSPSKKKIIIGENVKKEIVEYYLQYGASSCEKKFQVPRQTVRNWALKNGDVNIHLTSQMKKDAVKDAKEAGVKKTLDKYAVSRSSLYNWSKLSDVSVNENQAEESIDVEAEKGKMRRTVFFKKKPAVVKVPKEKTLKKSKPKKIEVEVEPTSTSELPDWAQEFIKKSVPKIKHQSTFVLKENEILFTNDMFTVSTGKTSSAEEESLTDDEEKVTVTADEENEDCDIVARELFDSFPFSTQ